MESKVKKVLQEILSSIAHVKINKDITPDTDLVTEFGLDSLQLIILVVKIEQTFKIEISDDNLTMDNLSNYGKLVAIICNNVVNKDIVQDVNT